MMHRILVVDDEEKIRAVVVEYARFFNYAIDEASDGQQAIDLALKNDYDCIILDLMLPKIDGFMVLKKIKSFKDTPIIVLSARFQEDDKLYVLNNGGDDYVTKPFSPKELMARIKLIIERNIKVKMDVLYFEDLSIDIKGRVVKIKEEKINLTLKEFEILIYLIKNKNIVISREILLQKIWSDDYLGDDRTVDTHIKMLRKNLQEYKKYIITVRGIGYKFET